MDFNKRNLNAIKINYSIFKTNRNNSREIITYKFLLKFFLFIVATSTTNKIYSQSSNIDYYLQLDKAKTNQEKLKISLEMHKANFLGLEIKIANYYYSLKKNKSGFKFLKRAIKNGETLDREYVIASLPNYDLIRIKKIYSKLRAKFYLKFNEEMYQEIKYLYNADQYLAKEKFYGGRREQHPIRKKIFQNNLTKLKDYIINHNDGKLPQYNQIGNLTTDIAVMLLHHTRLDSIDEANYAFFESLLKEEVLYRKTYTPYTYIQFVDNMQQVMEEGKLQIYGHFRNFKTNRICPLKYPEKVDSLRAVIGLEPLKEYARKKGFLLPENYIEK